MNFVEYFHCYKEPLKGYYLDKNESLFKNCYNTCEVCEIKGDDIYHNCLECNINFNIEISINNYKNCYKSCEYYYYFDNKSNFYFSCPYEYPVLIQNKNECISYFDKYTTEVIINNEEYSSMILSSEKTIEFSDNEEKEVTEKYINNIDIQDLMEYILKHEKNETKEEEEIKYYNKIIVNIEKYFTSDNYDTSDIDKGEDQIIQTDKMVVTLTSTQNQKSNNNTNKNMTSLDLGNCETELRNYYNISDNETLYIKKTDIKQEGMKIPKI